MAELEPDAPTDYWGRQLLKTISALELHAEDFDAAGQKERAAQISMVLLKQIKEIYVARGPQAPRSVSADQIAALEAEVAAMSDEELERALKER
jgi:hypothetical protein